MKKYIVFSIMSAFFTWIVSAESTSVSFESHNMPGWYIGIRGEEAMLMTLDTDKDRECTTFNMVPGLADSTHISIQFVTDPNYYLRHQQQVIKLHEYSTWMVYKWDATFKREQGIADMNNKNLVSFRACNYPNMLIRHRNKRLYIEAFDGSDLFKSDATFIVKPPNWDGNNNRSKVNKGKLSFTRSREASFTAFIFYNTLIVISLVIVVIIPLKKHGISR
jgi:hypothetical protein